MQAAIILRYVRAFLTEVPMLAAMVERETADTIELTNRVTIAVATCSYRSVRGVTLAAAICDELAFWRIDGANPDREVMTALRPAMATIPGALLLAISTLYLVRNADTAPERPRRPVPPDDGPQRGFYPRLHEVTVRKIRAGHTHRQRLDVELAADAAGMFVIGVLDATNVVGELDEDNNFISAQIP